MKNFADYELDLSLETHLQRWHVESVSSVSQTPYRGAITCSSRPDYKWYQVEPVGNGEYYWAVYEREHVRDAGYCVSIIGQGFTCDCRDAIDAALEYCD